MNINGQPDDNCIYTLLIPSTYLYYILMSRLVIFSYQYCTAVYPSKITFVGQQRQYFGGNLSVPDICRIWFHPTGGGGGGGGGGGLAG